MRIENNIDQFNFTSLTNIYGLSIANSKMQYTALAVAGLKLVHSVPGAAVKHLLRLAIETGRRLLNPDVI